MATLDIRKERQGQITRIRFDESADRIVKADDTVVFRSGSEESNLCAYDDLDIFIAACKKAKELWGK